MGFVRLRLRAERRRPRRWLGAVLLLALVGSASLIAAQAARRTDTAFNRALAVTQASDAVVNADTTGNTPKDTACGSVDVIRPSSGVFVLPTITNPASWSLANR
jgi:hypothetical protein